MGNLKGVDIQRGAIGASVLGRKDAISGLLVNAPEISGTANIIGVGTGDAIKLTKLADAEAHGITAAYDEAKKVRVHRHISEFFRMAGEGTTLYLMFSDKTTMNDTITTYGKKILIAGAGEIRQLAVGLNPPENSTPQSVNGINSDVYLCIKLAQELYDWAWEKQMPCQMLLEGRDYNAANAAAAANLRGIDNMGTTVRAEKVSVCIGQDWQYAGSRGNAIASKMADVGTLLGSVAAQPVNHNVGEVAAINLTNEKKGAWLVAGLSNGKKISEMEADLSTLDDKGYIFPISYPGYAGKYWNNDHTCTPVIQDENGNVNEYSISYGRTHDKAARTLYLSLLPRVKSTQLVDKKTGLLPVGVVKDFEGVGDLVLGKMERAGEISGGKTVVDATSHLLVPPKELRIGFTLQPTGTVDVIKGTINLKTTI